jgi:hypothetical protein
MSSSDVWLADGWLCVPYDGPDICRVWITVGGQDDQAEQPAYLDWSGGLRVAKIRPPAVSAKVSASLLIEGRPERECGSLALGG